MKTGNKSRVLFLRGYLEEHTDDDHCLTTEDLINVYKAHGFSASRQTISDDVAVLNASGFEVLVSQIAKNRTKTNAYHIGARLFELAELKLLVDAVSSSRFITAEKSEALIDKLSRLTNAENRDGLKARIYVGDRLKTTNPNVLVNIDVIFQAIQDKRKISFHYWDYSPTKKKVFRHDGELYVASPHALVWNEDRYYAAAYSDKREKIIDYRVDRMCDVEILDEEGVCDPDFNVAEHSRKMIKMYNDNLPETEVKLRCENEYMKNIIDRFGEKVKTKILDKEHFQATVTVAPSSTFLAWVFQYKGGIRIEGPAEVKEKYETMLTQTIAAYDHG